MVIEDFEGEIITNPDENSQAAAASMKPYVASQRRRIWLLIKHYDDGLACWEVEQITGSSMSQHQPPSTGSGDTAGWSGSART